MEIGIIANIKKEGAKEIVRRIVRFCHKNNLRVKFLRETTLAPAGLGKGAYVGKEEFLKSSLIIAIGGDGTILTAAHLVEEREIPIMGINVGSLGFLAFFSPDESLCALKEFLSGKGSLEERIALKVRFKKREYFALNDATVNMGESLRAIGVVLRQDEKYICRFIGDGVIIATPTGSTAYSLACGGSLLYPTLSCFIITPIAPHALSARPLILPATKTISAFLEKESESGFLVIDGQIKLPIKPKERVSIQVAAKRVKILVPPSRDYFRVLRQKMRWAE